VAPRYWKPIQTGVEQDDDSAAVQRLSGCRSDDVLAEGVRLRHPVSPHRAAELAGTAIDVEALVEMARSRCGASPWIVEGAGGVLVPLTTERFIIDLMAALGLPALIVARSSLGTINHTLLTMEALGRRGVRVAGIVLVGPPHAENRTAIERYGRGSVVGELPLLDPLGPETLWPWADRALDGDNRLLEFLQ